METMESTNWRRFFLETAALVGSAILCAVIANALASRERKVALPGDYSNALKLPVRSEPSPLPTFPATSSESQQEPVAAVQPGAAELPAPGAQPLSSAPLTHVPEGSAPTVPAPSQSKVVAAESRLGDDELLERFPPSPDRPYREVAGDEATALYQAGALFIDARRSKVYEEGHIAGARSLPVWESDVMDRVMSLVNEGRRGELPVVIYCSGGECEDSHMLSEKLFGAGFTNLLIYKDGWPDWLKRGGKASRGPNP
jgi:rhodanese-related sulfurtransferase